MHDLQAPLDEPVQLSLAQRGRGAARFLALIAAVATISACGGGGGSSEPAASGGSAGASSDAPNAVGGVVNEAPGTPANPGSPVPAGSVTVKLTATATDPENQSLSYDWKVTSGSLSNVSGATADWKVPDGQGVHFAYVQVRDGAGGYTERQLAVATDSLGTSAKAPPAVTITAPAATDIAGGAPHGLMTWTPCVATSLEAVDPFCNYRDPSTGDARRIYLVGAKVSLRADLTGPTATTDIKGQFRFPKLPSGDYTLYCAWPGQTVGLPCYTTVQNSAMRIISGTLDLSGRQSLAVNPPNSGTNGHNVVIFGEVALNDGTRCGTQNEYFGTKSAATVELLVNGTRVAGPVEVNDYNNYVISARFTGTARPVVRVRCEGAPQQDVVASGIDPTQYTALNAGNAVLQQAMINTKVANRAPAVTSMSAVANGATLANGPSPAVLNLPSDKAGSPDFFLTYKGIDSRLGACLYYRSIGAVESCDAQGNPSKAITYEDWKRARKLAPYNGSLTELNATYVNLRDLGFVRRMRAMSAAPNDIAYVVCNHAGPTSETQAAVDAAVDAALAGRNFVACVAMDYSAIPGVNGGAPFTKFYVFGPDGSLLLSVNLDGRREKFVPGNCVVCHGGDQYAKRFPTDGSGNPDIGARFLPFDLANFAFSSKQGLREADQAAVLKGMNQLLLLTNASQNARDLIAGWYPNNTTTFDRDYVPAAWATASAQDKSMYRNSIAPACRTCHVNLNVGGYVFEGQAPAAGFPRYSDTQTRRAVHMVYGGLGHLHANHAMPNALVTFNHFWDSQFGVSQNMPSLFTQFGTLIDQQGSLRDDTRLPGTP